MYEYRKLSSAERAELVAARRARGFPPHSPPHVTSEHGLYFLTATCYEHRDLMPTGERRTRVLDELFSAFIQLGIEIRAWVVLPNHYHLLLYVPENVQFGAPLRLVHGRTSRVWNQEDGLAGRKVWYRYADRAIRSERHYYTTINYIHYNPVKHGHVLSPYAWEESSISWYLVDHGRAWLRDVWRAYPLRDYGKGWDDP